MIPMQLPVACPSLPGAEFISLASLIYKRQTVCKVIGRSYYRGRRGCELGRPEAVFQDVLLVPALVVMPTLIRSEWHQLGL